MIPNGQFGINPFLQVKDHVLLPQAKHVGEVDKDLKALLTNDKIREIVNLLPDDWLGYEGESPSSVREVYYQFLTTRIQNSEIYIKETQHARQTLI